MPARLPRQPAGLFVVCAAEFCERFAGGVLTSLLVLYLTERVAVSTAQAVRWVALLSAAGYVTALLGGWLLGVVLSALGGTTIGASLLMVGFLTLGLDRSVSLPVGCVLLVLGSGLFRPSITVLLTQLYDQHDPRRAAGHSWFWVAINVGGTLAPFAAGMARHGVGWRTAFGMAATGMAASLLVLLIGRNRLAERAPSNCADERAPDRSGATSEKSKNLRIICAVGCATLLYTVAFAQVEGSLLLWARDRTDLAVWGWQVPAPWFAALPCLLVLLLSPVLLAVMNILRARGKEPSDVAKMGAGVVALSLTFLVMAGAAGIHGQSLRSPLWLLGSFTLLIVGELLVAPVGLALLTKVTARRYLGLVSGLWYAVTAVGYMLAGEVGVRLQQGSASRSFLLLAAVLAIGAMGVGGIAGRNRAAGL